MLAEALADDGLAEALEDDGAESCPEQAPRARLAAITLATTSAAARGLVVEGRAERACGLLCTAPRYVVGFLVSAQPGGRRVVHLHRLGPGRAAGEVEPADGALLAHLPTGPNRVIEEAAR